MLENRVCILTNFIKDSWLGSMYTKMKLRIQRELIKIYQHNRNRMHIAPDEIKIDVYQYIRRLNWSRVDKNEIVWLTKSGKLALIRSLMKTPTIRFALKKVLDAFLAHDEWTVNKLAIHCDLAKHNVRQLIHNNKHLFTQKKVGRYVIIWLKPFVKQYYIHYVFVQECDGQDIRTNTQAPLYSFEANPLGEIQE